MKYAFYNIKNMIMRSVMSGCLFGCQLLFCVTTDTTRDAGFTEQQSDIYTDIANVYLKSFNLVDAAQTNTSTATMSKKEKSLKLTSQELNPIELRHIVFDAFVRSSAHKGVTHAGVLDMSCIKKMELLAGQEDSTKHLLGLINRTQTVFGEAALARMLAMPICDMHELKKRQEVVKELVSNQELFNELKALLATIKKSESHVLGFWKKEEQDNEHLVNSIYFDLFGLDRFNTSPLALEMRTRLASVLSMATYCEVPFLFFAALARAENIYTNAHSSGKSLSITQACTSAIKEVCSNAKDGVRFVCDPRIKTFNAIHTEKDFQNKIAALGLDKLTEKDVDVDGFLGELPAKYQTGNKRELRDAATKLLISQKILQAMAPQSLRDFWRMTYVVPQKLLPVQPDLCRLGVVGSGVLLSVILAAKAYFFTANEKHKYEIARYVHEKMIGVADVVRGMQQCHMIASTNEHLCEIASLKGLAYVQGTVSDNAQFNDLLTMLKHKTFEGVPSFFSRTGRVLASYKVMQQVKDAFIPALEALGELDAYMSIAKLYKEFQHKRVGYTFVRYVENKKPLIRAVNFWNPFVSAEVVVPNTIMLGVDNQPGNVIITGPNTGGKSTVIKGVLLALILAQSCGIAPAEELVMTPFTKLNCHLNITDDIANGTSLFKAEVLKAKELINCVRGLKTHEFSCTVMDEAFNGTEPKAGAEASYKFSEQLAAFDNSMVLLATHFPELTALENLGTFKNMQVKVTKRNNGSFERPFKLEPGISTTNIALDLLREEGVLD